MMDAAIDTIDDRIGFARELIEQPAFYQPADDGIVGSVLMHRKAPGLGAANLARHGAVHGLDDIAALAQRAQLALKIAAESPARRAVRVRQPEPFERCGPADQQCAIRTRVTGWVRPQVDEAAIVLKALQTAVETGPALGADLAAQGLCDFPFGAATEFGCDPFLRAAAHPFADIVAVDDQVLAIVGLAAHQDVDVRVVSVPMIDSDPVEPRAKVMRHVVHQLAGEGAQVFHLGGILGRDDEPEVVPVILAAFGEEFAIGAVAVRIEQSAFASLAVNAVALEIGEMAGERSSAKMSALLTHHARLDDHPALGS